MLVSGCLSYGQNLDNTKPYLHHTVTSNPFLVFLAAASSPHPSTPPSVWHFCSPLSLLSISILPSIFYPFSLVFLGSVAGSRVSTLKHSQHRPMAGRNPRLRGNYLPHSFQQHTKRHTILYILIYPFSCSSFVKPQTCMYFISQNFESCNLYHFLPFVKWHFFCYFEGWPDPLHLPIEPMSLIIYECLHAQVCVGPSAASIPISAAARVIVPQWLQCRQKNIW